MDFQQDIVLTHWHPHDGLQPTRIQEAWLGLETSAKTAAPPTHEGIQKRGKCKVPPTPKVDFPSMTLHIKSSAQISEEAEGL